MGQTVRREPVRFGIPATPKKHFVNIVDFKGLQETTNPLAVEQNSAADILNLYVNENHALTTRPRVEKTFSLPIVDDRTVLDVHKLPDDSLLIHLKVDTSYKIQLIKGTDIIEVSDSEGLIDSHKIEIFVHDGKTYLMNGSKYMIITENETVYNVNEVTDVYIPTRYVGRQGVKEEIEPLNLLTNKYKVDYYWDNLSGVSNVVGDAVSYSNNYIIPRITHPDNVDYMFYDDPSINHIEILKTDGKNILFSSEEIIEGVPVRSIYIQKLHKEFVKMVSISGINFTVDVKSWFDCDEEYDNLYYINPDVGVIKYPYSNPSNFSTVIPVPIPFDGLKVSNNGEFIAVSGYKKIFIFYSDDLTTYTSDKEIITTFHNKIYCANNKIIYEESEEIGIIKTFKVLNKTNNHYTDSTSLFLFKIGNSEKVSVSENEMIITAYDSVKSLIYYYDLYVDKLITIYKPNVIDVKPHNDNKKLVYVIINDVIGIELLYSLFIETDVNYSFVRYESISFNSNSILVVHDKNIYMLLSSNDFIYIHYYTTRYDSDVPLLQATYEIKEEDPEYDDWYKYRQKILTPSFSSRFNNNYILASGDHIFISSYNDPTYFTLEGANKCGTDDLDVTGFNIITDSVMTIYKKDKLYLLSINETVNYVIMESKAQQGNVAINNCIITTLNELPIQIMNTGFYALAQTENVASDEHIAELISNNITSKFVKELNKEKILSINYKYWTLFYLNKHIYVLDNRSLQWFYWELPLHIINWYKKDDELFFADYLGNFYKFTETDIINRLNNDTEYYDDGDKIINWFWESQILNLGTLNYYKQLLSTGFIFVDSDKQDQYGMNYRFKIYREMLSEVGEITIKNDLNYITSITKRTHIPRFNFLQLKISNIEGDYNNNKLYLIGLMLKYKLLEVTR